MGRPAKTSDRVQGPVFSEAPVAELGLEQLEDDAPESMLPVDDDDLAAVSHFATSNEVGERDTALTQGWNPISTAPCNRSVYLTDDPADDSRALLCYWRTSRFRNHETRQWEPQSYWARTLNRQRIDFDPVAWREASGLPIFN